MMSHLGAMYSTVLGAASSQRRLGRPAVGFAFIGDGASSTGDVHESLNLAALWSLPVVFVIENNQYAYSTPVTEQYPGNVELWQRAAGYGIEGLRLDCGDTEGVTRTLADAIAKRERLLASSPRCAQPRGPCSSRRIRGGSAATPRTIPATTSSRAKATPSLPPSPCPSSAPGWRANLAPRVSTRSTAS